jgi:hypothetical protein
LLQHQLEVGATTGPTAQIQVEAHVHTTGASIKAFLLTQIQEVLHSSETMDSDHHQLGGTLQATEIAAVMVLVQLQLGEIHLTQSVLATASAAN